MIKIIIFVKNADINSMADWLGFSDDFECKSADAFVKLFNSAKYKGTDIGYGTTPVCRIEVNYDDGSTLLVYEYKGHNYSVSYGSGDDKVEYYVNSEELDAFVWELIDKYQ